MVEEKMITNKMFIETLSSTTFNLTVEKLSRAIENKSWKILQVYDLKEILDKSGNKVLPVKVISLCQPNFSNKILKHDNGRIISSIMPCRISVYEKSDGKTYISRMNIELIAVGFEEAVEMVMSDSANEIEEIIENAVAIN